MKITILYECNIIEFINSNLVSHRTLKRKNRMPLLVAHYNTLLFKGVHDHLPFFSGPIWKNEKTPLVINKNAYNASQPPPILWKNFAIKKIQKSVAQAAETSKMWSAFQKLLQHLRNSDFQNFMFGTLSIKFSDVSQKILEKIRKLRFFSY